jgi:outer membrane murein-binding lipoprotein Lpp
MTIDKLSFGKNLRPSTVDTMNKLNEVIAVVNDISGSGIDTLKTDVATLKSNMTTAQAQIATANENIANNATSISNNTTDINAIKVTLYTPLDSSE